MTEAQGSTMKWTSLVLFNAFALFTTLSQAQTPATRSEEIKFAPGTSSTTVTATIKGYDTVDYTLEAKEGQEMTIKLEPMPSSLVFTVSAPGASEAMDNASMVTDFSRRLPASGKYVIRVGLMRNDARRNIAKKYSLAVTIK